MNLKKIEQRSLWVSIGLTVFGILIVGRLFFLQVVSHDYYTALAERQHFSFLDFEARRGNIYFQEKEGGLLSAASTKIGFALYIDPRKIDNPEEVYEKLVDIIPEINRDDYFKRVSRKRDPFEIISHRLETDVALQIKELNHPGVGVTGEEWRFYPARTLAAHVLGFVGYEGDQIVGRYGIEYSKEDLLKGEIGSWEGYSTLTGIFLDWVEYFHIPRSGADIVLTIKPQIQLFVEGELKKIFNDWKGERVGAIVMNPQTGRILAMASYPTFDPNAYGAVESLDVFINPIVEHVYELGSVFKPLTLAAGLDLGKITPASTYVDQGFVIIGKERIENYDGKGRGVVTMQGVLNESLNTGAVFVMNEIGGVELHNYLERFGLADRTGIELPGEVLGKLSNLESGRAIEYATASFGQGIAVTPLAFLRAVSVLANGGHLVKPFVVERVIIDGVLDNVTNPTIQKGIIKKRTSEEITAMLVKTVDDALLNGILKNERYSIAAKTGTAQIPRTDGTGYSGDSLHSFFGYGPAYDAQFAVFLFLVRPQGERYASRTLARPFMEIMEFLLSYYNVPPDR